MSDNSKIVRKLADELWQAELDRKTIDPLTSRNIVLSRDDAYRVQLAVADTRRQLGHRVVGKKIGLVSRAMQQMAGFGEPDYGHLFDPMRLENGADLPLDSLIQLRIEPEVAFVLDKPLRGPGITAQDVLRSTAFITPSLEIVDSRIHDWKIQWIDTVADNGSSARYVLGDNAVSPRNIDFRTMGVVLETNRKLVSTSTMAEVLGSPVHAVAWLANKLSEWDIGLDAGEIVLPGSPCRAIPAAEGDYVEAHMSGIGSVGLHFT